MEQDGTLKLISVNTAECLWVSYGAYECFFFYSASKSVESFCCGSRNFLIAILIEVIEMKSWECCKIPAKWTENNSNENEVAFLLFNFDIQRVFRFKNYWKDQIWFYIYEENF